MQPLSSKSHTPSPTKLKANLVNQPLGLAAKFFPSKPSTIQSLKTLNYADGSVYHGNVGHNQKRCGQGSLTYGMSNLQFESLHGTFENDEPVFGVLTLKEVNHKLTACFENGKILSGSKCSLQLANTSITQLTNKPYCMVKTITGKFNGEFTNPQQDTPIKEGRAELEFADGTKAQFKGTFNGYQLDMGKLYFKDHCFVGKFKDNLPFLGKLSILKESMLPGYFKANLSEMLRDRSQPVAPHLTYTPQEFKSILKAIPYLSELHRLAMCTNLVNELKRYEPNDMVVTILGIEALYDSDVKDCAEIKYYFDVFNRSLAKAGKAPYRYCKITSALPYQELEYAGIKALSKRANQDGVLVLGNKYQLDAPKTEVVINFKDCITFTKAYDCAIMTIENDKYFIDFYHLANMSKIVHCPRTRKPLAQANLNVLPYLTNENAMGISGASVIEFLVSYGFVKKEEIMDEKALAYYDIKYKYKNML
jgi:hypothetical protein